MKFRVSVILRNESGETTEMSWLKSGEKFDVMRSVASILAQDNDAPWFTLVSIHVDAI